MGGGIKCHAAQVLHSSTVSHSTERRRGARTVNVIPSNYSHNGGVSPSVHESQFEKKKVVVMMNDAIVGSTCVRWQYMKEGWTMSPPLLQGCLLARPNQPDLRQGRVGCDPGVPSLGNQMVV